MKTFSISFGVSPITENSKVKNCKFTLEELDLFFSKPNELMYDAALFDRNIKDKLSWWSGAHYKKSFSENQSDFAERRKKENVIFRNLITLDIDYGIESTFDDIKIALKDITYFLHSSVNCHNRKYKFRLIIPIENSVQTKEEYFIYVNYFQNLLGKNIFDNTASEDIARGMFSPAVLKNEQYLYEFNDVKKLLELNLDGAASNSILKRRKPSSFTSLEGSFCATYSCMEIMAKHATVTGDYICEGDPLSKHSRWTYTLGTTKNGIRFVDDGELLHCDHDSCPLLVNKIKKGNKQWSSFDLYVYFAHNSNEQNAISAIENDAAVTNIIRDSFAVIEDVENLESRAVGNYVTEEKIDLIKKCPSITEVSDFIKNNLYVFTTKDKVYFVIPTYNVIKKRVDYEMFSNGDAIKSVLGDHIMPKKENLKANTSIWNVMIKIMPAYRKFAFMPYNPIKTPIQLKKTINTFTGFTVNPVKTFKENTVVAIFEDFIFRIICSSRDDVYVWVMDWIADIFQNPAEKKGTSLVLYSNERGTGKSSVFDILKLLLSDMAVELSQK